MNKDVIQHSNGVVVTASHQPEVLVSSSCRRSAWQLVAVAFALACCTSAAVAGDEFPPELLHWSATSETPLFTGAGEGHWDVKIRERGWIMRDGDQWKMWYTGYDGTREGTKKLGYATSADGIHWKRYTDNPIYDKHWVEDMMVVKQGETYYMFAEGKDDQSQLLTSQDGIEWTRQGTLDVRLVDGKPIEAGPYGTPTAWYEDGTWYLFYERRDAGVWLATSKDMKIWKNLQDEPVLSPGQGKHDQDLIAMNQIIKYEGRYYACYHGTSSEPKPNLWTSNIAVSSDLIHWKKYAGNPLLPISANKSSNILVRDGKGFRMYTMHDKVFLHLPRLK